MSQFLVSVDPALPNLPDDATDYQRQLDVRLRELFVGLNIATEPIKRDKTSGYVLTADSSDLNGVVWTSPSSSSPRIFSSTADAVVQNTITETTCFGSGNGSLTLAANALSAGKTVRIRMMGYMKSKAHTMIWKVKLGSTTIITSLTYTPTAFTANNGVFNLESLLTCRTAGATGTVMGQLFVYHLASNVAGTPTIIESQNTATSTVDTTASQTVDLTLTWGTADALDIFTVTNATVELL